MSFLDEVKEQLAGDPDAADLIALAKKIDKEEDEVEESGEKDE